MEKFFVSKEKSLVESTPSDEHSNHFFPPSFVGKPILILMQGEIKTIE